MEGLTKVVATIIATFLIEKAGRKTLLSTSFAIMGVCMFILAAGFSFQSLAAYSGNIALIGTKMFE